MKRYLFFTFFLLVIASQIYAQKITQYNYIKYLPLRHSKIIKQTDANEQFNLYGDAINDHCSPQNGIDDQRYQRLMELCARFTPILFLNTPYSIPLDFRAVINHDFIPHLYIDTWDLSTADPKLINRECINFAVVDSMNIQEQKEKWTSKETTSDFNHHAKTDYDKLLSLIKEFNPLDTHMDVKHPARDFFKVLYFDLPGEDEKSWKKVYNNEISNRLRENFASYSKIYAHPFIHKVYKEKERKERYEFVIQYWFFYPFNDGGNNHEGDWEHLNVRITTRERMNDLLTESDIKKIIGDDGIPFDLESLIIKKVDYYLHHFVMILDYMNPNIYLPDDQWEAIIKGKNQERYGESWEWEEIRKRAAYRHPIAYIGGDNKGLDQLLSPPGGKNRDSHATYPFPGLYKIGAIGAEEVKGKLDFYEVMKDPTKCLQYSENQIQILPDWERIKDLVLEDPAVTKEWSWLVLPIRWGFPASKSPAAGVLRNADTGNLGPVGPTYNTAWNRVGDCEGYQLYDPHKFSPEFPLKWEDNFKNSWGFLNLTVPTIGIAPLFDILWKIGPLSPIRAIIGRKNPIFYPKEAIPFRRLSLTLGSYPFFGDDDFALLLQVKQEIKANTALVDTTSFQHLNTFTYKNFGFQINYFIGSNFVSENLFRYSLSKIKLNLNGMDTGDGILSEGDLQLIEYAGSLRYNILTDAFQPYIKFGYGYSSYRVKNIKIGGKSVQPTNWFHEPTFLPPWPPKNWLPNTYHLGLGFEFLINRNFSESVFPAFQFWNWKVGFPDFGVILEYAFFFHQLGEDVSDNALINDTFISRHQINFKFSISF